MIPKLLFLLLSNFSILVSACFSQSATIFGTVREVETRETVPGAYITDENSGRSTLSNRHGYFNIEVPMDSEIKLRISQLGYVSQQISMKVSRDTLVSVDLVLNELQEVVVTAPSRDRDPISTISIPIRRLNKIPMVLGEPDLFKALALLPGVATGVEGTSGLHVRGGTPDQNLILLDDTPVYNPSHLFGLFSVFHPEMVKDIQLIKGGFPAKYGGRLSSIIDVRMKDGNKNDFEGEVSLGLINSRISLEGPLGNEGKTSYHLGGRISYLGALMKPIFSLAGGEETFSYVMHDWNAKLHHVINDKNELFFSYYFGRDNYEGREGTKRDYESFGLNWGNQTATLRYKKIFNSRLFANFSAWYTEYRHEIQNESVFENSADQLTNEFIKSRSGLHDYSMKADFEWLAHSAHEVNFGTELNFHQYRPGEFRSSFFTDSLSAGSSLQRATEIALYLEDRWQVVKKFDVVAGVRYSAFNTQSKTYQALEPRLSAIWEVGQTISLRASYARMRQYIHQLSSNGVGLPNDIWVPATDSVPPQNSQQWTLGLIKDLPSSNMKLTLEGFYKISDQLIESVPGTNYLFIRNNNWEQFIYQNGIGRIYGLETLLELKRGKFDGWLSYTYQKNFRRFDAINEGEWFPARFDRRNNISMVGNYQISTTWDINWTWSYSSGQVVTLPVAVIPNPEGELIPVFSRRNNNRMPDFHRLDVGANYRWKGKRNQRDKKFSFGIINAYNRVNPLFLDYVVPDIRFNPSGASQQIEIIRRGAIPLLPYFNYTVKF